MSDIENHANHAASSPDKPSSRGSGHESTRMRRRDGDRKTFHDHRGDRHRDNKYEGFKGRDKYDSYNRQRGRDYDRHNDYDRDRDTRSRYGAHSKRSRRESRSRSRSRSPSQSEGKRTSGFDMAPPATGVTPTVSGQMPGIAHMIQGATQNFSPYGISQIGALSLMQVQPMTQQATRHARRVYVGGLPPFTNEQTIASFFSHVMLAIGGNSAGTGDSVVNVYINHEKKFAFVEMRTVEEASNAMALDGIVFEGVAVRVRRPTDYNPSLAAVLGPCQPSSNLNLSAVGLTAGANGGSEGLDRIFVGGLPYYFTEVQMRELLQAFGPLRNFDIVRDKDTGNSKGYGFCIYQDPAVTDIACASLDDLKMGDKTLIVRRATQVGLLLKLLRNFARSLELSLTLILLQSPVGWLLRRQYKITLTGFMFLLISALLGYIYSPQLDSAPPRWVHVAHGLLLFLYQTFDAIDGKQLERTNSSSPLGELFDHGCDALACALEALAFGSTAMCGRATFWWWLISAVTFFGATWEYYFINTLILPVVNGPTEGLMLIYLAHFFTAFVGAEWWVQQFGKSLPFLNWLPFIADVPTYQAALFLMVAFGLIPTLIFNVQNVYKVVKAKNRSMLLALAMLYPFVVLVGGVLVWDYLSPSDIIASYPHLVVSGSGLAFGYLVGRMILAHFCEEPKGLKTGMCMSLLYLPFAIANALASRLNDGVPLVNERLVLLGYCAFTGSLYLHFATSVIREITDALGIYCFRITRKEA